MGVIVGDGVTVGEGVMVGEGVIVGDGVTVGEGMLVAVDADVTAAAGDSVFNGEIAAVEVLAISAAAVLELFSTAQPTASSRLMLATSRTVIFRYSAILSAS